jgi:hypothetical protein
MSRTVLPVLLDLRITAKFLALVFLLAKEKKINKMI